MTPLRSSIGVDIGGGSTKIGLVGPEGQLLAKERIVVSSDDGPREILSQYAVVIDSLLESHADIVPLGIGVGFPGPIHTGNRMGSLANIPALNDFPIADWLEERFKLPARLENDAAAAGLGEALFGGLGAQSRQLLVTVGTGIGVAFTVSGHPQSTSGNCLGDIGHTLLVFEAPRQCRQGCLGCLESVASGAAIAEQIVELKSTHPNSALALMAKSGRAPSVNDLVVLAQQGDAVSRQLIQEAARWIGRAVASWVHIFAPDFVLIGGGLSAAGPILIDPIEAEARRLGLPFYLDPIRFEIASLGNDAGIIGAAAQMFRQ